MYWEMVLKEVLNKNSPGQVFAFTNIAEIKNKNMPKNETQADKERKIKRALSLKKYFLGEHYKNIYFTRREAECMLMLLKGKTISAAAKHLSLSPRTVEFYLKNMKIKIGCRTKFKLIELILPTDFLQNVDFTLDESHCKQK